MRIVLTAVHPHHSPQAIPLANAFLQAYQAMSAADADIEIVRMDFFPAQPLMLCVEQIIALQPDAVAFSLYVWNREMCRSLTVELRRRAPQIRLFAGGPEATADPAGVLEQGSYDFLVCGEGETIFSEVCKRLSDGANISPLPGVATLTANGIIYKPALPVAELDTIPSPWLQGTLDCRDYPGILWQLSRGCGFACDFCFDSRDSHGVRRFSLKRIEDELRHFSQHGVNQVFVLDSTFNQDLPRAKTIVRLITKIAPQIHFHFEVRSEFIDRELAQLFARITCSLQIGLQSANPQVLKNVNRTFRRDDFSKRISLLNESGAVFGFDLMYGLPGDTLAGFRESLDFALGLYPNHLDIFPLAILPGTELAKRAAAEMLHHLPEPPYTLVSSSTFSAADMLFATRLASACDIFYTRGKAVAWFMGMLDALNMKPSPFFEQFSGWFESQPGGNKHESELSDEEIWRIQRAFLMTLFSPKKLQRFLAVVLDLADYHYHYAAAVLTPPQASGKRISGSKVLAMVLRRADAARLAAFQYDILEILDAGVADVRGFSSHLQKCGSYAVIYPTSQGVATESLEKSYYMLLEMLDGITPLNRLMSRLDLSNDQVLEFIEFAVTEGIVVQK